MTIIPLSRGLHAIVDDEDAERVLSRRWGARKGRGARSLGADRVDLACFILGVGRDQHIRYLDGNRYNCRRANLQVEGRSFQMQRAEIPTGGTGYRGVCRDRRDGKFDVYVTKDYRRRYLGRFDTAEDAARTYDRAARELFGEAARVNFP